MPKRYIEPPVRPDGQIGMAEVFSDSDGAPGAQSPFRRLRIGGTMIVKLILIVILAVFLIIVYRSADARDIDMSRLQSDLAGSTDLAGMKECSDRELKEFIGIDASVYDAFIYYKSEKALGVEELLIIKAGSKQSIPAAKDLVQRRIDAQIKAFEGYGPEQVQLMRDAVVYTRGQYLFYCVSHDTKQYEEVFRDAI